MLILWVKVLHIFFVIGWMSGLFYLPRIFVHYQFGKQENVSVERLPYMAQKLFSFMTIIGILAILSGVYLLTPIGFKSLWIHIKLTLVLLLVIYHFICGILISKMKKGTLKGSHIFYRFFNELPLFFLLLILLMVVFKPSVGSDFLAIFGVTK